MPTPPLSRAAYLLAGGKSTRMGQNKAFLNFRGQTLLTRALYTLSEASSQVTIIGDPATFAPHAAIPDIFLNCGPLAGIHTALTNSQSDLNLMLAVDMPFVTAGLLKFLLDKAADSTSIVTVPLTSRGLQPLCAVYRRAFAPIAERAVRAGNYKIDASFANLQLQIINEQELAAAAFSEENFFNVNTPEDRQSADRLATNG
ncbi:MAG: molybdenum cofactor guanylyltransferase [Terriglobales bacterium]